MSKLAVSIQVSAVVYTFLCDLVSAYHKYLLISIIIINYYLLLLFISSIVYVKDNCVSTSCILSCGPPEIISGSFTLWNTMDMMKKSSRKLSEARGQSKWKKMSVKSRVRNWKLGLQKDERRSFSPATVVRRTSQLNKAQTRAQKND